MAQATAVHVGQRYGRLVVTAETKERTRSREIIWRCRCDCGGTTRISSGNLIRTTRSCGCLRASENRTKVCISCFQEKSSTDFYLHKGRRVARCKPCHLEYNRQHRAIQNWRRDVRTHVKYLLQGARVRAARKGWAYDLDAEWLRPRLERGTCEATGLSFVNNYPLWAPSIDRIDNARGYTKSNCRLVVCAYNQAKGRGTDLDVQTLARAVLSVSSSHL